MGSAGILLGGFAALCSVLAARADDFLAVGVAQISSQQVDQQFHFELLSLLGHGDASSAARLQQLQEHLRPMHAALPKASDGTLDPKVARYALHRFFVQKHGWHMRGLEAGAEQSFDASSVDTLADRIPNYVLELFERHHGGRAGLMELAMIAATLEDVVHSEAIELLSTAFAAQNISVEQGLSADVERRVLATYMVYYINPDPRWLELSTKKLNRFLDAISSRKCTKDTAMWTKDLQATVYYEEESRQNPFVNRESAPRDFNSLVQLVEEIGEKYGHYQDIECRAMKNALVDLSDGLGRVRLSNFYETGLNSHHHFVESPEYLRFLGLLDETDPEKPSVILTNYIYSRSNCLASSSLYSVCCKDQCEPLMASLERSVAGPLVDPYRVAEVVATFASDTVSAPRELPALLHRRLDDIARRHGGSIPIHGRLFAQWMHHAFPNECPYPHTSGSLASPLSPLEWRQSEPNSVRRVEASAEEMQAFIEAAVGSNSSETLDAGEASMYLPWTDQEELLIASSVAAHPMGKAGAWFRLAALLFAVFSLGVGLVQMLRATPLCSAKAGKGSVPPKSGTAQKADSLWV